MTEEQKQAYEYFLKRRLARVAELEAVPVADRDWYWQKQFNYQQERIAVLRDWLGAHD